MDHNMVLSYDYAKQKRWRWWTNAPPSQAILMTLRRHWSSTCGITQYSMTRTSLEATDYWLRITPAKMKMQHVSTLLAVLMAIAMHCYYTVHIAWWRRFVAFIKATQRRHRACTNAMNLLSFKSFRRRRWLDRAGWLRNLLRVWHINGKPRTWKLHRNTYMGWQIVI